MTTHMLQQITLCMLAALGLFHILGIPPVMDWFSKKTYYYCPWCGHKARWENGIVDCVHCTTVTKVESVS